MIMRIPNRRAVLYSIGRTKTKKNALNNRLWSLDLKQRLIKADLTRALLTTDDIMFIKAKFTVYNYTKINRFKSVSQLHTTNSIQMTTIITLLCQYVILHTCEERDKSNCQLQL